MPKIHVLDKHTAELIAAGEVVERPSSAIKELLENSIDAGATAVTVEIQNGGNTYMRVTDNGCGIASEDVRNAFLRHATSKIKTESDLDAIGTLGFRGEALASISAVAKVELLTRPPEYDFGTRCVIHGGEEQAYEEAGCPVGTTIIVRDLFYNTPARMKFLKKDVSEGNAVSAVVDRLVLSHPEVSFKLIREGKETLLTPGDSRLESAVYAVLGREFSRTLLPVSYEMNGIGVTGLISKPTASRPNRNMQYFFINGRYVKTRTAMAALEEAYKHSIMVGKFPSCVLNLSISPEEVDVNVHPAKIEVRFTNERPVFSAVYYAARSALAADDSRAQLLAKPDQDDTASSVRQTRPAEPVRLARPVETARPVPAAKTPSGGGQLRFNMPKAPSVRPSVNIDIEKDTPRSPLSDYVAGAAILEASSKPWPDDTPAPPPAGMRTIVVTPPTPADDTAGEAPAASDPEVSGPTELSVPDGKTSAPIPAKYIGQLLDTYILAQQDDKLLLIDKHAAHERILFEALRKGARQEGQLLLTPVQVTLPYEEYDAIIPALERLNAVGFEMEEFGGKTILVRALPMALERADVPALVAEIAGKLAAQKSDFTPDFLDWLYHSVSCRAAIKAGNKTSDLELSCLMDEVLSRDDIRYCPHGRPTVIELTQGEIERRFGRA